MPFQKSILSSCAAAGVVAPDHADVQHVQVIVGEAMHTTVIIVVPERNDHADEIIVILGLHKVIDVVPRCSRMISAWFLSAVARLAIAAT